MGAFIAVFFLIAVVIIYFLPSFIANARNHPNEGSILVINLFLGWTLLGWVAALAWAVSAVKATSANDSKSLV